MSLEVYKEVYRYPRVAYARAQTIPKEIATSAYVYNEALPYTSMIPAKTN